jgi:hypothetical protein
LENPRLLAAADSGGTGHRGATPHENEDGFLARGRIGYNQTGIADGPNAGNAIAAAYKMGSSGHTNKCNQQRILDKILALFILAEMIQHGDGLLVLLKRLWRSLFLNIPNYRQNIKRFFLNYQKISVELAKGG